MDIHRSRFVPYPASPINAIAFSRTNDKDVPDPKPALKLAIGRADGSIEIWSPERGDWVQETVFPGGEGRSIEALVWTQDPSETDLSGNTMVGQLRLFSIGSSASVTEWNLNTGLPRRVSTGNFSEVWCIAAQPRQKLGYAAKEGEWTGQDIVAGCGDGTLAVLSTAEDDLTFKRFLARSGSKKTRCMSVTWQNRDRIVAGFSDSTIRIYDARSGSVLRSMSLGAGLQGASKNVLVWRVKCLPNGDIVSADSNGEVVFWDGRSYSMMQRISGHESDCLDLVTSSDGQTVFSGGIDGKVAVYKIAERDNNKRKWAKLSHRRMHQGDIKSMAVYDAKQLSVVVTGGADTVPSVAPLRQLNKENHRRLPGLPQNQPLVSAPDARLLLSWWDRSIHIWQIGHQESIALGPSARNRKLVGGVTIKGEDNISSASISKDGRLLAVSTFKTTKLFQLRPSRHASNPRLRCRAITLPSEASNEGSRIVAISPDGKWLTTVSTTNEIKILRVIPSVEDPKHLSVLPQVAELEGVHRKTSTSLGLGKYDRTITRLAFSSNSTLFCVSNLAGHIDTFSLTGELSGSAPAAERVKPVKTRGKKTPVKKRASDSDSDSDSSSEDEDDLPLSFYGQVWGLHPEAQKLPKLDSQALVFTFHPEPGLEGNLFVVTQHHQIHEFDTTKGKLSEWSKSNPTGVLPQEFRGIKERAMGLVWDWDNSKTLAETANDSSRQARIWLYGSSWMGMLDISQDFGTSKALPAAGESGEEGQQVVLSGKRKRITEEEKWEKRFGGQKRRKGKSGAGDEMQDEEKGGMPTKSSGQADSEDEDEDLKDMDTDEELGPLRKADESEAEDGSGKELDGEQRRRWWCTYKYRPILGLVSLGKGSNVITNGAAIASGDDSAKHITDGAVAEPLEVVLVERPHWDLEHLKR
ncbi:WD domain-containing protein 42 [Elsinoe australis]|uniref:WD domain-containing protein 42 n=1 Tax=Elsinoe australis TaxID=40998 RepID=A0A4U7APP7_9PEZI|nr:WD domain-containing protein 42 [Elsinoe australis]